MADPVTAFNAPPKPANLSAPGIFFLVFVSTWTLMIFVAMGFLIIHRKDPIIRTRGLWLSLASVCFLHPYWVIGHLVVPVFPTLNMILAYDLQYFFMGIWLPIGIGLFQAANMRFLYVAKMQRQFAMGQMVERAVPNPTRREEKKLSPWQRMRSMDYSKRVAWGVGVGIIVQILLTVAIWFMCKKYHPTFGIPGTGLRAGTVDEQSWWLNQGWEWWPTVFWQFIWTWIVAPILIVRAWNIEDTLGWRTQTIGCCISGLHATPMYLIASYVPAFKPINKYFTPSNWIHLSMMIWIIFFLFIPCYQIITHQRLRKRALESNAKQDLDSDSILTAVSVLPSKRSSVTLSVAETAVTARLDLVDIDEDKLLTTKALEHVLRINPGPLQDFSALRDFSGENIAFLVRAASWKEAACDDSGLPADTQRRYAFNRALEIYASFISPRDAQFPLNISSRQLEALEAIFGEAAKSIYGEGRKESAIPTGWDSETSEKDMVDATVYDFNDFVQYDGPLPEGFDFAVFDDVVTHVRQLVFLNTWPKFVKDLRLKRRASMQSEVSQDSWASRETLVDRTVEYFRSLMGEKSPKSVFE